MEFKEILKELLENNTQSEIAQKIGVKQSQISEWLKGKAKPGYDTIKAITVGLNLNPYYILGLRDIEDKDREEEINRIIEEIKTETIIKQTKKIYKR